MKAKIVIFLTAIFLAVPSALFAQTIKLDKIELSNKLRATSVSANIYEGGSNDESPWVAFMAHYQVSMAGVKAKSPLDDGKWLDDVEVTWEMLYKPNDKATEKIQNYISTKKKIKYTNVTEGKHTSVVLIDPKTLKRYFKEGKSSFMRGLKLRFSMKVGGKTVKTMTSYIVNAKEDKKGTFRTAFDSEDSYSMEGVLLNRNETPFKYSQTGYFDKIVEDDK